MKANSSFEKVEVQVGNDTLEGTLLTPPTRTKRLVVITPLAGSSAMYGLSMLKNLAKKGSQLMSYTYRGVLNSTGTFSTEHSTEDTRAVLSWASEHARQQGIPLHAISICYGSIPLFSSYSESPSPDPVTLAAASGLAKDVAVFRPEGISKAYATHADLEDLTTEQFGALVRGGNIDPSGSIFLGALESYLTTLFPTGANIGRDHFEKLYYERTDMGSLLRLVCSNSYFDNLSVPHSTPVLYVYGSQDEHLHLTTEPKRKEYERRVTATFPQAQFQSFDMNHFIKGPGKESMIEALSQYHLSHE